MTSPRSHWRQQPISRPASLKSVPQCRHRNAAYSRCVLQQNVGSVHQNSNVVSLVSALFFFCRPLAIVLRVGRFVVNSFDSQIRRAATHIRQKLRKVVSPLDAHRYSTAAVITKAIYVWIVAAREHRTPNPVLTAYAAFDGIAMCSIDFFNYLLAKAPATFCKPTMEAVHTDDRLAAAVALAEPKRMFQRPVRHTKNRKSPKSLSREINDLSHGGDDSMGHVPIQHKLVAHPEMGVPLNLLCFSSMIFPKRSGVQSRPLSHAVPARARRLGESRMAEILPCCGFCARWSSLR